MDTEVKQRILQDLRSRDSIIRKWMTLLPEEQEELVKAVLEEIERGVEELGKIPGSKRKA